MLKWLLGLMMLCGLGNNVSLGQEGVPAADPPVATSTDPAVVATTVAAPESAPAAAPASTLNTGDQAWLLASSAMVLLMTPGLAFFYGGLVGRKNVLSILMQCFMCMGVVTVLWVLVGYSIAFSGTEVGGGFCGNPMTHFLLNGVATDASFEPVTGVKLGISQQTFMVFQMMFAIITPGLIIGAFAERMKFLAFTVFIALWSVPSTAQLLTGFGTVLLTQFSDWEASMRKTRYLRVRWISQVEPLFTSTQVLLRWLHV